MPTLESPPAEQAHDKPYSMIELTTAIYQNESRIAEESNTQQSVNDQLVDLYSLLKDAEQRNNSDPNASVAKKNLHASLILTEIAHARVALIPGGEKYLSNTRELARWHQTTTAFVREVLKTKGRDQAPELISAYWEKQKGIFTHPLRGYSEDALQEGFEKHKQGVLAAVAFEIALENMLGWELKSTDVKIDAGYAIDYMLHSPEGAHYVVQLTSTRAAASEAVDVYRMRDSSSSRAHKDKQSRFAQGAIRYMKDHSLSKDDITALYVILGQHAFDEVTGEPTVEALNEVSEAFAVVDGRTSTP